MKNSPLLETNGLYGLYTKYYIDGNEVSKEDYYEAFLKYRINEIKDCSGSHHAVEEEHQYKYTEFEDYFRKSVPFLWNVKEWDNETIKSWLKDAFDSARSTQNPT